MGMTVAGSRATIAGLGIAISLVSGSASAQTCNGVWSVPGIGGRQLYLQRSLVPQTGLELRRRPTLQFSYIVPGHLYTSGAVVVKAVHSITTNQPNANPSIAIRRESYKSPCKAGDILTPERSDKIEAKRYRNFHRYRRPDQNIGVLHADLGNRPANYWAASNDRCASTSDWDIAPHFLFEESLADRQPIGARDYVVGRFRTFGNAVNPSAVANELLPDEYSKFHNHTVFVLPYRKSAQQMHCVSFEVAVPRNTAVSRIMIIDADDARWPRSNPEVDDPQRVWPIRWQK